MQWRVAWVLAAAALVAPAGGLTLAPKTSRHLFGFGRVKSLRATAALPLESPGDLRGVEPPPIELGPHVTIGGRHLTMVGVGYMLVSFGSAALMYALLVPAWIGGLMFDRKRFRCVDYIVRFWAWLSMSIMRYRVRVEGLENLPPNREAVMIVPNHTSFLDILTISAYVPRNSKYISKVEILRLPFIGWAMRMAKHIAIRRASRASQVRTLKDAVDSLKNGNTLVTFAEGKRSHDGRLMRFKRGPFTMAKRAGVRVLPISICGLHRFMPTSALMPLATPQGILVKIHPPIETEGRTVDEILQETHAAVASGLPPDQLPEVAETNA